MNNISVAKISIGAIAIIINNYKKIIEISILPIILMIPALWQLNNITQDLTQGGNIDVAKISNYMLIYLLLFIYGYVSLNINLYRLAVLGVESVFSFAITPINLVLKFFIIYIFIALLSFAPLVLNVQMLQPVVFVLIAHIMLNLVLVSIGKNSIKWNLLFMHRISIALLQFVIPMMIMLMVGYFDNNIFIIIIKLLLVYWTSINLGLIFNNLNDNLRIT